MKKNDTENKNEKKNFDLKKLAQQLSDMETERERWIPVWQEIAKYISPGRGIFDKNEPNQGDRKDHYLLDPTPLQALHVLSAGLQGGLTSPSRPWFRLAVSNSELADYTPVRLWLDEVEKRMLHVFSQSNVYNALHMLYQEVGAFGIGCMLVEEDEDNVLRALTLTVGEYCLSYGVGGLPNKFARSFWMTTRQMYEQFPEENLSEAVKNAHENNRFDEWFRVCHMIFPSDEDKSMRYTSVYWEEGRLDEEPLRVSYYSNFPVMAPRWEVVGQDFYGRGPGWDALGESKTLQEMRKDYLVGQKMMMQPPMVGPNTLRESHYDLRPNGVTLVDDMKNPNQYFKPLYQIQPDLPGQINAMQDSRKIIRDIFFADLFLAIIMNQDKRMTATEVNAINQEQMLMIGPVYERLDHELLDPFIGRTFSIMDRFGLIPQPPEELDGQELKIEYISMLAQAQQMVGLGGIDRLTEFVGGVAQIQPEVLDKLDADETIDQYARMLGVPAAIIRSDESVAEMRQQRAEQQQQVQQMEQMSQMAQVANQGSGALRNISQAQQMQPSSPEELQEIANIIETPQDQKSNATSLAAMLGVPSKGGM